jgi:hypothetical protein
MSKMSVGQLPRFCVNLRPLIDRQQFDRGKGKGGKGKE